MPTCQVADCQSAAACQAAPQPRPLLYRTPVCRLERPETCQQALQSNNHASPDLLYEFTCRSPECLGLRHGFLSRFWAPQRERRMDRRAPLGIAIGDGLPTRSRPGAGDRRRAQEPKGSDDARWDEGLELLPPGGREGALAEHRAGVPRRDQRHCRGRCVQGCQVRPVGRRGVECQPGTHSLLHRVVRQEARPEALRAGALQRLRGDGFLDHGWASRSRPQLLDRLRGGRALERDLRRSPRQGPPLHHGRASRDDPQRRRFRDQRRRHHDRRNHDRQLSRLRSRRNPRVRSRAQSDAIRVVDRRVSRS